MPDENAPDGTGTEPAKTKRQHRATYASDRRNGGYMIRVVGPTPEKFAGREVPVTTRAGAEHMEHLTRLTWTGADRETGELVALYQFQSKPKGDIEEAAF